MNVIRQATFGTAALCLMAISLQAQSADGNGWDWIVAPYGWAASIGTDLERAQPPAGGVSTDRGFDDIVDKIDGAFQIHIEGQGDRFGMFADFTYLGLADEREHPRFHTESDLDMRLFELAAVWSPGEGRYRGLDLFAGLRYIDVDLTVRFVPANTAFSPSTFDGSDSYSDFMFGARYTWALSDRWGLTLRGDGSFGDTEGTWNASAVAQYRMKHGMWVFGYRYLSVELETGDTSTEITMSGPMIGYGFTF
ncbi:hypothetical protein [Marilutibacter alkalisoli]|uniref:Outer membrane beta-barrel protein n=1 Tax=Marilutibacter alkalisoli TaxID=2591633 RepID=A0A514BTT1_9GAMM|nr:hypothetical protein [Lysobacter alkalisoli]QDH70439.1 hypothetical protein FKV23_10360 [Lysobacter alkalisoli]